MSGDNLTKDDLILMMQSYENMITMHKTILDESAKIIEKLDGIIVKQDLISTKQGTVCISLSDMTKSLQNVNDGNSTIVNKMDNHHEKSLEAHGSIKNKIHLGWIGMGTIIIGLLGLFVTIMNIIPKG